MAMIEYRLPQVSTYSKSASLFLVITNKSRSKYAKMAV